MGIKKKLAVIAAITVLSSAINLSTNSVLNQSSCELSEYNANAYNLESILNSEANKSTIIIDPGHDSTFTGFPTKGYKEEVLNLELSRKIEKLLADNDYKVLMIRNSESPITKDSINKNKNKKIYMKKEILARANYIKENNSDCAIVVHYNAYRKSSKVNGTEIYFYGLQSTKQLNDTTLNFNFPKDCRIYSESSKNVAERLAKYMNERGTSAIVYGSDMRELVENPTKTVIYLEAGYLTNPDDLKKATTEEGQMETAKLISDFFRENKEYISSLKQDSSNLKIIK